MGVVTRTALGLLLSSLVAVAAYRRAALSIGGAAGAAVMGALIFAAGGWVWGALLITFFVLSSLLSRYRAQFKAGLADKFAKGSQRDLGQVLANGGMGALLALAHAWLPHPVVLFAFVGAMGTVNADTWATELGVLARRPPRLITTGRPVEPGTSGGISLPGTLATLAGGTAIGLSGVGYAALDGVAGGPGFTALGGGYGPWLLVAAGAVGGLAGSLTDSLLGATVQAIYFSDRRHKETERMVDPDGTPNRRLRGRAWLNNDWVNFLSSIVGTGVAALIGGLA